MLNQLRQPDAPVLCFYTPCNKNASDRLHPSRVCSEKGERILVAFLVHTQLREEKSERTWPFLGQQRSWWDCTEMLKPPLRGGRLTHVGGSMVSWKVQTLKPDLLLSGESLYLSGPPFPPLEWLILSVAMMIEAVVEPSAWHKEGPQ